MRCGCLKLNSDGWPVEPREVCGKRARKAAPNLHRRRPEDPEWLLYCTEDFNLFPIGMQANFVAVRSWSKREKLATQKLPYRRPVFFKGKIVERTERQCSGCSTMVVIPVSHLNRRAYCDQCKPLKVTRQSYRKEIPSMVSS